MMDIERWKAVHTIHGDVLMLANKKGDYVKYSGFEELHKRTVELEMKVATKQAKEFKRYENCADMQAEIDELKMNLSHSINNSDAREYKLQTEIDGLKFMLRRILLETMHDPITRKTFSRAELLCDQTQE